MDISLFDFHLPEELIAQTPLPDRSSSRMLYLNRASGRVEHAFFHEIGQYLKRGDTLVLNDSRVIPARLFGVKEDTGAQIELLLLKPLQGDEWETLARPGKRLKPGARVQFGDGKLKAEVVSETEGGGRIIRFEYSGIFHEILDELGEMPLPPYIKETLDDPERYQTVYAKNRGSAAAPTAGLHFTPELLQSLQEKGVDIAFITLHIGLGTFRPVAVDQIEEHVMHSEYYEISRETVDILRATRERGGRIVSVGTTATRTLESVATQFGELREAKGWTDIYIYPGYEFKVIDGLITNFHLPKSSLVMLVSALAGRDAIIRAYEEAIEERYRFFSFGDAMLIL